MTIPPDLKDRLQKLGASDPELKLFGAASHHYYLCPALSEPELQAFEQKAGLLLPSDYRDYVRDVSSGGVGPGSGLKWLTAALVDEKDDDAWRAAATRHLFPTVEARRWCEKHLSSTPPPPVDWPNFVPEAVRRGTASPRSERDNFISKTSTGMRGLLEPENLALLGQPFPFAEGLHAESDLTEAQWISLGIQEKEMLLDELWDSHGFEKSRQGTLPLCDYGAGVRALLVVVGKQAGRVWVLDTEGLRLEPFGPESMCLHVSDPDCAFRGNGFLDWLLVWLDWADARLDRL